jgi:hypothetical protein
MTNDTLMNILLIGFGIILPFGVVKFLIREKYAQQVLLRNETDKARTMKSNATLLRLLKLFLYVSLLVVIVLPYALSMGDQVDLLRSITLTVLMLVTIGLEYIFQKWLFHRLRSEANS